MTASNRRSLLHVSAAKKKDLRDGEIMRGLICYIPCRKYVAKKTKAKLPL